MPRRHRLAYYPEHLLYVHFGHFTYFPHGIPHILMASGPTSGQRPVSVPSTRLQTPISAISGTLCTVCIVF